MTSTATPKADKTPQEPEAAPAAALHTGTSDLLSLVTRNLRQSGIYIAFVAIIALFAVLTGGVSLSPGNITNIVLQYSYILVLAIGMVLVIIAGHIDLSVGSVVALTGATSGDSSPTTRPERMTTIRSPRPRTSGSSEEITSTATPCAASSSMIA